MANAAKILHVCAADGGARLLVTVEELGGEVPQRTQLCVLAARLQHLPQCGEINAEELAALHYEDALGRCIAAAMRSLGAGDCSPAHLVQKLCAKGFAQEVARDATRELVQRGFIKEEQGAVREAERGLQKLWGNKRILLDLRAKGYGEQALQAAAVRLREENSVTRCCLLLQKKRLAQISSEQALQKLIASLLRYGYTQGEIRAALKQYFG